MQDEIDTLLALEEIVSHFAPKQRARVAFALGDEARG